MTNRPHVPRTLYRGNSFNPPRDVSRSIARGWDGLCPNCAQAPLLREGLEHIHTCSACGEDFRPADVSSLTALLVMPVAFGAASLEAFLLECILAPPILVNLTLSASLAVYVIATLLPRVKAAALAYQWANWVGAFDPDQDGSAASVEASSVRELRPVMKSRDRAGMRVGFRSKALSPTKGV